MTISRAAVIFRNFFAVTLFTVILAACAADGSGTCYWLKCPADTDMSSGATKCLNMQPMKTYTIVDENFNNAMPTEVGTVSWLALKIREQVLHSAEQVFTKIIENPKYQNFLRAMALLFVMFYGATIALGMANPSPMELVVRSIKLAAVFLFLSEWDTFFEYIAMFFEAIAFDLTAVMTSAVTGADINPLDALGFIDQKVLPFLFSPKFAVTVGAIGMAGTAGPMLALMLVSVMLAYLWSLVIAIQIYILSAIARALLYAIAPIFIMMLFFQQTKSLFDGWLKQLINFSLQPVLLIAFLAFFNGIFFNFLDNLFNEGYRVCFEKAATAGEITTLSGWRIDFIDEEGTGMVINDVSATKAMSVFNLFVVLILALTMVKMNQWVVQAASQLTEGGLSFGTTMGAWSQTQASISSSVGSGLRSAAGLPLKGR